MKKGILLFLIACLSIQLSAQEKDKKLSISKRAVDSQALIEEAETLIQKDPSLALDKLDMALSSSIANKEVINEANCYLLLAEINENIREWDLAADYYEKAHRILIEHPDHPNEFIKSLSGMGNTYLQLQQYENALKSFQSLFQLSQETGSKISSLLNISEVYFQQGIYQEALSYAEQAEKLSLRTKVSTREIQNQKAKIYARMNELEKAQKAYSQGNFQDLQRADDVELLKEQSSQAIAQDEITKNLRSQNRYQEEIDFRSNSIQQNINNKNLYKLSKEKVELGELLIETGEGTRAINELKDAVAIADSSGNYTDQAEAYLSLAEAYHNFGDQKKATENYVKYSEISQLLLLEKDSLLTSRSVILRKQKMIEESARDFTIGEQSDQLLESKYSLEQSMIIRQRLIIYGLLFVLLVIIITSYFIYKNAQASKLANQLLALKSLRSQMNPHFIFNALNSVNQFISQNDERAANKFLADFSKLMRLVLEHSHEDFITLSQEKEIIALYLKLEQYRFREKFDFTINIEDTIDLDAVQIPPMLIQPYIENAVWHGLRYKKEFGKLAISIERQNQHLVATITDDGIGREKSFALKTDNQKLHNSKGLKNIEQRLRILNRVYKTNYQIQVEDLDKKTNEGTIVTIHIPDNTHG